MQRYLIADISYGFNFISVAPAPNALAPALSRTCTHKHLHFVPAPAHTCMFICLHLPPVCAALVASPLYLVIEKYSERGQILKDPPGNFTRRSHQAPLGVWLGSWGPWCMSRTVSLKAKKKENCVYVLFFFLANRWGTFAKDTLVVRGSSLRFQRYF